MDFTFCRAVRQSTCFTLGENLTQMTAKRPGGDLDPSNIDPETFMSQTIGGMGRPVPVKIDEVYVKGKWGSRVAIANSFRSAKGRVFLAGDAGQYSYGVAILTKEADTQ